MEDNSGIPSLLQVFEKSEIFSITVSRYVNKEGALHTCFVGYLFLGYVGGKTTEFFRENFPSPLLLCPEMLGKKSSTFTFQSVPPVGLTFLLSSSPNIQEMHILKTLCGRSHLEQAGSSESVEAKKQNCIPFQHEKGCLLKHCPSYFGRPWKRLSIHKYLTALVNTRMNDSVIRFQGFQKGTSLYPFKR